MPHAGGALDGIRVSGTPVWENKWACSQCAFGPRSGQYKPYNSASATPAKVGPGAWRVEMD